MESLNLILSERLAITTPRVKSLHQSKIKAARLKAFRHRGFTLIEVLVVIIILGVLIGMVSLSIAPQAQRRNETEVQRLRQLFIFAEESARQTGQALRWVSQGQAPTKYQFLRRVVSTSGVISWVEVGLSDISEVLRQRRYDTPPQRISKGVTSSNLNPESPPAAANSTSSIELMFSTEETNSPMQLVFEYPEERIVLISDGLGDYRIVHEKNAR